MPAARRSHGFTLFLAALSALPALATDMSLPAVAAIEADYGASQAEAAAVIAIFLAGFAVAPIAIGPLADRFGRKPAMAIGLIVFTLSGLACALAPSVGALLGFRLAQGVGAGAVGILPRAVIRDLFEGREARLRITTVAVVFGVAPVIAPTLGALVLAVASWRWIYVTLAAVGGALAVATALSFEESLPRAKRASLTPRRIAHNYHRGLTHPLCLGFAIVNGLVFAGLFAYINVSPLLFMQGYGFGKNGFAALFALTASGVIVGALVNGWLVRRIGKPKFALDVALALATLAALALLAVSLLGKPPAVVVALLVVIYVVAFGLTSPNASHEAMHPMPDIAGVVSALMLTAQMLFGSLGGALSAGLYRDGSPRAIAEIMVAVSLAAAALYGLALRGRINE